MSLGFSAAMREATAPLLRQILDLPFNRGLAEGTLPKATFAHYVIQDALYLAEYSRVLAALAGKAPDRDAVLTFAGSAQGAIRVEQALHEGYVAELGIAPEQIAAARASPSCRAYTDFLHAAVHRDGFAVGTAAVLPCFRIYWDVGQAIAARASAGNPYAAWIATYSDEAFGEAVRRAEAVADRAHARAGDAERLLMRDAYERSAVYEWLFWDAAWRLESWPIAA